jgi:hypothetical protein
MRRASRRACRQLSAAIGIVLLCAGAAACGEDDDDAGAARAAGPTQLTLAEVESVIDRGDLQPVRTDEVDERMLADLPPYLDAVRYETRSGRTFHVIVFVSARDARDATRSVVKRNPERSGARAANVLVVFPELFARVGAYRAVERAMRRLRRACRPDSSGDERLRRLCVRQAA